MLQALYDATDGDNWRNSWGWMTDAPQEGWHGVGLDGAGRLSELNLSGNGLRGRLPTRLAALEALTTLRIGDNAALGGRLPLSLARLDLSVFHYAGTDLCASATAAFRTWITASASYEGTGVDCDATATERESLWALYKATDGPNWNNSEEWLTEAPLEDWHGLSVDADGAVIGLKPAANALSGAIPAELAELTRLEFMDLFGNDLTGPIPAELGGLDRLWWVPDLGENGLTGPIPRSSGNCPTSNTWTCRATTRPARSRRGSEPTATWPTSTSPATTFPVPCRADWAE